MAVDTCGFSHGRYKTQVTDTESILNTFGLIRPNYSTGSPSSMYVYLDCTILYKSRNIRICMGKRFFLKLKKNIYDLK